VPKIRWTRRRVSSTGIRLGAAGTNKLEEEASILAEASGDFRYRWKTNKVEKQSKQDRK
jgi:hypothetical protein